jgi:hypothetical protein
VVRTPAAVYTQEDSCRILLEPDSTTESQYRRKDYVNTPSQLNPKCLCVPLGLSVPLGDRTTKYQTAAKLHASANKRCRLLRATTVRFFNRWQLT